MHVQGGIVVARCRNHVSVPVFHRAREVSIFGDGLVKWMGSTLDLGRMQVTRCRKDHEVAQEGSDLKMF
jgi:hypothetical protein